MFDVALPWRVGSRPLIQGLRNTGLFNNDWDVVYGIALFVSCSLPQPHGGKLAFELPASKKNAKRLSPAKADRVFRSAQRPVEELASDSTTGTKRSAAAAVWSALPEDRLDLCRRVKKFLGYPGNPPASLLASLFDEVYHGGALYRRMYGLEPRFHSGPGFIEKDKVIITSSELNSLAQASDGRLAVATGRPRKAAEYSLGNLISYFRLGASVFIGDGDIRPSPEAASFRKPSGKSLLWAKSRLHSRSLLYIGDSAEDLQMVHNARKSADGFVFAGVYTSSYEPGKQLAFFKEEGAELILPSVRAMTRALKQVAT